MDAQVATDKAISKARGRKESNGTEAVIKMKVIEERIADLVTLHSKKQQATDKYNDAVKAVAEASGLLSATVSKFVSARAGESFEEQNAKVQQLALVFDEVGAVKGSRQGTL